MATKAAAKTAQKRAGKIGAKAAEKTAAKTTIAKGQKPAHRMTATAKGKGKMAKATPATRNQHTAAKTAKAPAKTKAAPPPADTGSNVFWKFLERKEAQRKAREGQGAAPTTENREGGRVHPLHEKFARFAGPRRRSV